MLISKIPAILEGNKVLMSNRFFNFILGRLVIKSLDIVLFFLFYPGHVSADISLWVSQPIYSHPL